MFSILESASVGLNSGNATFIILELVAVLVAVWGAVSAFKNRHQLGKWWRGPGADVSSIAADTIDVLKERISQLETDVADLRTQLQTKDAQIVVLTDMITKASTVDQLKTEFEVHAKAILASHAQLHLEIAALASSLKATADTTANVLATAADSAAVVLATAADKAAIALAVAAKKVGQGDQHDG
jgi:hypothetical protein